MGMLAEITDAPSVPGVTTVASWWSEPLYSTLYNKCFIYRAISIGPDLIYDF